MVQKKVIVMYSNDQKHWFMGKHAEREKDHFKFKREVRVNMDQYKSIQEELDAERGRNENTL